MNTSKNSGYRDFEWAVRLNRFSLEFIGLWPEDGQSWQRKLKCNLRVLFIFLSVLITCTIPSLHSLMRIRKDILLLIDNLQFTLPVMASILKLVIFWWKVKGIALVLKMVAQDWATSRTERERSIMIEKAQLARFIITCAYVIMLVSITLAVVLPAFGLSMRYLSNITDPGRPMPMQTYYIYDTTKSPQFELTYFCQSFSMCMCIMPYTGIDNFLGLLVLHICSQLDILKARLINLDKFTDFHSALKACVIDHTRILRAIYIIEDTFNLMLLILFLYFGILFALYGFLGITLLQERRNLPLVRAMYLVTMVINTFAHMCLYCAVGEILISRCNDIHHAVYNHNWYNLDPKNTRTLILLMVRSSRPVYITAGKVFPMTMSTFCNLLKTSAGYISVLHATIS